MPTPQSKVKFIYGDAPTGGGEIDSNAIYLSPENREIRVGNELIAEEYKLQHIAQSKNSIYRGKFLGNEITEAQWETINSGEFKDMFLGDYWVLTMNGDTRAFEIAAFNYPIVSINNAPHDTSPHITLVANVFYSVPINEDARKITGAFFGSDLYSGSLQSEENKIISYFGDHAIQVRYNFSNGFDVNKNRIDGWVYVDRVVCMLDEITAYGSRIVSLSRDTVGDRRWTHSPQQLPLYSLRSPNYGRSNNGNLMRTGTWLMDISGVSSSTNMVYYVEIRTHGEIIDRSQDYANNYRIMFHIT